jgi:hypothetical protein
MRRDLGIQIFSKNNVDGIIANCRVEHATLIMEEFTIQSNRNGMDLLGSIKDLKDFAKGHSCDRIRIKATIINIALIKKFGTSQLDATINVNDSFAKILKEIYESN